MTNSQKYTTAAARASAFSAHCEYTNCEECGVRDKSNGELGCVLGWLELEAEEKVLPCPFCGSEVRECLNFDHSLKRLRCVCGYSSEWVKRGEDHSSHNRVARAVMKEKEGDQ